MMGVKRTKTKRSKKLILKKDYVVVRIESLRIHMGLWGNGTMGRTQTVVGGR